MTVPNRLLSFSRLFLKTSIAAGQGSEPALLACDKGTTEHCAPASGRALPPVHLTPPAATLTVSQSTGLGLRAVRHRGAGDRGHAGAPHEAERRQLGRRETRVSGGPEPRLREAGFRSVGRRGFL